MLNSNEPIKVLHLQKLANQSILNGTLVKFFQWKQEKLWSFDKARNVLIRKKKKKSRYMGSKKICSISKLLRSAKE